MVCPPLFSVCMVELAALTMVLPMSTIDCSAVLATPMLVLTLVMVSVNAEMFESCDRAAIAKPSLTPIPA